MNQKANQKKLRKKWRLASKESNNLWKNQRLQVKFVPKYEMTRHWWDFVTFYYANLNGAKYQTRADHIVRAVALAGKVWVNRSHQLSLQAKNSNLVDDINRLIKEDRLCIGHERLYARHKSTYIRVK